MKTSISLVLMALAAVSLNCRAAEPVREAPSAALDRITLVYLDHKIYPNGAVVCESEVMGTRSMVGCWNVTLGGKSVPHIWLYEGGNFKPVNGKARQLAEGKFSAESDIAVMPLPLPSDIDIGSALDRFSKS